MADWFWDALVIYIAGATIATFAISVAIKLYKVRQKNPIELNDDEIGVVLLGTIFWPIAIPIAAFAYGVKLIIDVINHTSTAVVKKITGTSDD